MVLWEPFSETMKELGRKWTVKKRKREIWSAIGECSRLGDKINGSEREKKSKARMNSNPIPSSVD